MELEEQKRAVLPYLQVGALVNRSCVKVVDSIFNVVLPLCAEGTRDTASRPQGGLLLQAVCC